MRQSVRRLIAKIMIFAVSATLIAGAIAVGAPFNSPSADAFTGDDFDPGYIISDGNFYDPNAMSAAEVQAFIDGKISACASGTPCLKNLHIDTFDIPATPMCRAYAGAPGESAATIIYKVGFACGVSQAALLVILQKEQGLVNNPQPSMKALSAAMGVGCYDNGKPCVDTYSGFFNQLFNGAYLLKRYTQPAGTGAGTAYTSRFDLRYPVGQVSQILYHPNTGCGTKPVFITNQATHALYIYTPYTPNQAALNHLRATGDACSSYGNRNFWQLYYDWFGDPTLSRAPVGWLDAMYTVGRQLTATGWSIDYDTAAAIKVSLTVDGIASSTSVASAAYPGLGTSFPGYGDTHGFSLTTPVSPGSHNVCVTGLNDSVGGNRVLACRQVTVFAETPPTGWLDSVRSVGNTVTASGWAIDPDFATPTNVRLLVDGTALPPQIANNNYLGLGKSRPGFGDSHGFSLAATTTSGTHQVCVSAIDSGTAGDAVIGCRTLITTTTTPPTGYLDDVHAVGRQVTAVGWAIDPDTTQPISVKMLVDGASQPATLANAPYPGLGVSRPGYGDSHGFSASTTVTPGRHEICVTAINDAAGGNQSLSCRTLEVAASASPIGWLDSATVVYQQATLSGWTFDPDTANSIQVGVSVDGGTARLFAASAEYPGLGEIYRGFGDAHGFTVSVTLPVGPHNVCISALDDAGAVNRLLACRDFVATSQPPTGWLDQVTAQGRALTASGWALDPDTPGAISVKLIVDGKPSSAFVASNPYAGLGTVKPGFGDNHGYSAWSLATPGEHTACIEAQNDGAGDNRTLGCKTVTVAPASPPIGWVDTVTSAAGSVTAAGWAIDPDTTGATLVTLTIDGAPSTSARAGSNYPGLASAFPAFGTAHGYALSATATRGAHTVCVLVVDESQPAFNHDIGCKSVTVL